MEQYKTILQKLRINNNLTQQAVAKGLNYNLRTYQEYERGHISISIDDIPKIADFYNCSADYLVGMDDELKPQSKSFQQATGLSEKSVAILQSIKGKDNGAAILDILNQLFENPLFYRVILNAHNAIAMSNKIERDLSEKGQKYADAVSIENAIGNMKQVVTSGESYREYLMLKVEDEAKDLFESIMKGENDNGKC